MSALRIKFPPKMRPIAEAKCRHKIARGGRGSAKSWSVARILLAKSLASRQRWLCCRQVQKSIRESSHRLLADQIERMGLSGMFEVQRDVIRAANGSEFVFAGLQDHTADSLKSYEGLTGAWVEEAHTVTEDSANKLIPTVREPGSEVVWTYNPDMEDDYVHRLAESGRDDVLVVDINYCDNPWFPDVLEQERRQMLAVNQDLHDHIWGGKCRSLAGLLFKRHWFKRFKLGEQPSRLNVYLSSDYAGGPDPDDQNADPDYTEHGVWGLDENGALWALDWWYDQADPHVWIQAWLNLIRQHKPLAAMEEKGVILRSVDAAIRKAMQEAQTFVHRVPLASAGSKIDRALGFAARAAAGTVHIPEGAWGDRLINQLCSFTGKEGRPDDGVDVCSLLARGLDDMANAAPERTKERKPEPAAFTEAWMSRHERAEAEANERARRNYYR